MSEKRPLERSPRGVAKWVTLNTPDTKWKEEGEYRVVLLLKGKAATDLQAKIDDAIKMAVVEAKANKENAKHLKTIKASADKPYKPDTNKDGEETGFTAFNFKAKASGKKKDGTIWHFRPAVFDSKAQPIDLKTVNIWGGSEVMVSFELSLYGVKNYSPKVGAGVSLKMNAVQILTLKTGSGKDASAFGFEAQPDEDGAEGGEETEGSEEGSSKPHDKTNEEF